MGSVVGGGGRAFTGALGWLLLHEHGVCVCVFVHGQHLNTHVVHNPGQHTCGQQLWSTSTHVFMGPRMCAPPCTGPNHSRSTHGQPWVPGGVDRHRSTATSSLACAVASLREETTRDDHFNEITCSSSSLMTYQGPSCKHPPKHPHPPLLSTEKMPATCTPAIH